MRYAQRFPVSFFFCRRIRSDHVRREWNSLCCSPGCSLWTHKCNTHTHTSLEVSGECVVSASLCYVPSCCFSDFFIQTERARERNVLTVFACQWRKGKKRTLECRLDSHPKNGRFLSITNKLSRISSVVCLFSVSSDIRFWVQLFGTDGKCKESKEIRPFKLTSRHKFYLVERGNAPVYKYVHLGLAGFISACIELMNILTTLVTTTNHQPTTHPPKRV